jgi:hypothetical protein
MNKTTVNVHRWYAEIRIETDALVENLYVVTEPGEGLWLANEAEFIEWSEQ